ncbi:MAG: aspartyl protease family protein [Candidatus Eiseniibacteriota bacterium]|nr:MAG: aspartyl protease family protein [Candidatus Eisenbacteria bacterium]
MNRLSAILVALSIVLSQACLPSYCAYGEEGSKTVNPSPTAVNIQLEDYMNVLQAVQVELGSDTLPFIFDTGGGLTIITPQVADRIHCDPYGRVTGFRMSGERVDLQRCGELSLKVGGLSLKVETTVFDLMSLLPEGWPELGGVISLQTFRDRILTLDLAANRMTVETETSASDRVAQMKQMSARLDNQCGGSCLDVFIEVRAERGSIWLELDTGNSGHLLLAPHACRQLGLERDENDEKPGEDPSLLGEVVLDFVGLGPIPVVAKEQEMIYDGLINAATIRKLLLTMDLRTGEIWGKVREP